MSRRIEDLHPKLRNLAEQLVERCASNGLKIKITDCVRDRNEQESCVHRGTSGVHYPNSHHNWGTAFDFCRNDGRGAYNNDDGFFDKVGLIGQSIGLEWGGSWVSPVDKPHFQLPDWGTSTSRLKQLYGSPAKFKMTWSDDKVTQTEFNKMMDKWLSDRKNLPVSKWANDEMQMAIAQGITDGTNPQSFATREQVAAMLVRLVSNMIVTKN